MLRLPIKFTDLAANYCFSTWQQTLADFSAVQYAEIAGNLIAYNFGPSTPGPDDRDKAWWRTKANGDPAGKWTFSQGVWLMEHPCYCPTTNLVRREIIMLDIEEADIAALDGGEAGTVTDTSGPMWELVGEFAARMPIGAGTLPSGATLAIGDTGGEEEHILTQAELPDLYADGTEVDEVVASGGTFRIDDVGTPNNRRRLTLADGSDTGHNTLSPYRVVRFLRKSGRKYWRIDP